MVVASSVAAGGITQETYAMSQTAISATPQAGADPAFAIPGSRSVSLSTAMYRVLHHHHL